MPAGQIEINLLGHEDLAHTPQGRLVLWALTYGRYIMIGTEIVVLLAFISRFSLDRKLTDLKDEIDQKQAILTANKPLETEIQDVDSRLTAIKSLTAGQSAPVDLLSLLASILPSDVRLKSIDITQKKLSANVFAGTTPGFSQFLVNLQALQAIGNIEIGDISRDPVSGISFSFTADIRSRNPGT
ncbi:hypothetical protein M1555_03360 [Patescibacteria group bacterium]|nr:hypothetical protein [Patescibacteria group bacterium]